MGMDADSLLLTRSISNAGFAPNRTITAGNERLTLSREIDLLSEAISQRSFSKGIKLGASLAGLERLLPLLLDVNETPECVLVT